MHCKEKKLFYGEINLGLDATLVLNFGLLLLYGLPSFNNREWDLRMISESQPLKVTKLSSKSGIISINGLYLTTI